jgi:hypothetical protein
VCIYICTYHELWIDPTWCSVYSSEPTWNLRRLPLSGGNIWAPKTSAASLAAATGSQAKLRGNQGVSHVSGKVLKKCPLKPNDTWLPMEYIHITLYILYIYIIYIYNTYMTYDICKSLRAVWHLTQANGGELEAATEAGYFASVPASRVGGESDAKSHGFHQTIYGDTWCIMVILNWIVGVNGIWNILYIYGIYEQTTIMLGSENDVILTYSKPKVWPVQ